MKTLPVLAVIVIALGWSQTVLAQGAAAHSRALTRLSRDMADAVLVLDRSAR